MKDLENTIPPPLVVLLIGAAMGGVARMRPSTPIEPRLHFALTAVLAVIAISFGAGGILAFRRAKTTINPVQIDQASQVVTTGIFRFTRNPMYVGLTALLTTWAVWLAVP